MTVLDLMIKLQSLPPNLEVMIDHTPEGAKMFNFVEAIDCYQIKEGALGRELVIISHNEL